MSCNKDFGSFESFENGLKVCVGNYGYLNEGELHDAWIELPKTDAEIWAFLKENRLYDRAHEEIYISDYDGIPFGLDGLFGEHCPLDQLNVLAAQLQCLASCDYERLCCWLDACDQPDTLPELLNIVDQHDELPVYQYSHRYAFVRDQWGELGIDRLKPCENLGQELLETNHGLMKALESDAEAMDCFDTARYGERIEENSGYRAYQHHYVDTDGDWPDLRLHTVEEIKKDFPDLFGTDEEEA